MHPLNPTDQAIERVIELTYCHEIWRSLVDRDNKENYKAVCERYDQFFSTVIHSLLLSVTVVTYQLFEKRKRNDTVSISSLLRSLPSEHAALADRIQLDIDANWHLVLKVFALRNEVYAHRSNISPPEAVFKRVGITPNQLKLVVHLAQRCVALLADATDKVRQNEFLYELESMSSWATDDLMNLMFALKKEERSQAE